MSYHVSTLASGNKLHVWRYNVSTGSVTIDWTEGSSVWFWQWVYPGGSVMEALTVWTPHSHRQRQHSTDGRM